MNDQILNGYLQDFTTQHGLEKSNESDLFAAFVNFCIISKQTGSQVSLDDLDVDGGQDTGIDAIAILVNGRVVVDKEDVDYFRELGRLEVEFVFIQSKKTPKFDSGDIGKFLFGVRNFFESASAVQSSVEISNFREIKDYIYKNSIQFKGRPVCRLFYASTGKWTDDEFLIGRISADTKHLEVTGLFDSVKFVPLDAERLKSFYRELRNRVEKEVIFEKHTILPKIDRVQEAYLGILPFSEFFKLITDDEGEIQKSLFYDNVRDFQGGNPVNSEIANTLSNDKTSGSFVLLNNGVTIVAKAINKVGAAFRISDYQIVNGCQTSHVIHLNRGQVGDQVYVPIKLIVTEDPELTNQIIKATNRQTEVKLEAFESLNQFHRTLEEFYASFGKDKEKSLYYERRSRQYENTPIKPISVISLAAQTKSFLAMFLNEPHSTPRYYGELLAVNRDRLYAEKHSPFPYYTAALALSRVESFFRAHSLPSKAGRFRYHILLAFRLKIAGLEHPPLEGRKANEYCEKLCKVLWDEKLCSGYFQECAETILNKVQTFKGDKLLAERLRSFTLSYLTDTQQRPQGTVRYWNLDRGFGFVSVDSGQDVFVHMSAIREELHKYLREGERVELDIVKDERGPTARNVRIVPKGK